VRRRGYLLIVLVLLFSLFLFSCTQTNSYGQKDNSTIKVSTELGVSATEEEFVQDEYVLQMEPTRSIYSLQSLPKDIEILKTYSFDDVEIVVVKATDPTVFETFRG